MTKSAFYSCFLIFKIKVRRQILQAVRLNEIFWKEMYSKWQLLLLTIIYMFIISQVSKLHNGKSKWFSQPINLVRSGLVN